MKEYCNKEISVVWDPDKCIHAGECIKGLPNVFNREKTPWVNINAASSKEIMSVIERCPSKALTYKKTELEEKAIDRSAMIKIMKNGPIVVEGSCALLDRDGKVAASHGPFALCRCGGSQKKPQCDGTHIKIGFEDDR
jgi:uncharacterized Fe-S cluster protein YjdI